MDSKPSKLRNVMVKAFVICLLVICFRFAYVVTIRGESCDLGDFCFFSVSDNINNLVSITGYNTNSVSDGSSVLDAWSSKERRRIVGFYVSVFQDLVAEGVLRAESKSLCVETLIGEDVYAMREIGIVDSIGVGRKSGKPLVVSYRNSTRFPFGDEKFDFVFVGRIDEVRSYGSLKEEVTRVLRIEGNLVVHTRSNDSYSLNSFVELFGNCFRFVRSREIEGVDEGRIREIVMRKECDGKKGVDVKMKGDDGSKGKNKCSVPGNKRALVSNAEPFIAEEPLKPWITLKRNIQNVKYLSSMVDISFKSRYVYVDVGARSYGSSIGSWFRKQYPKQNRTFDVYAIEADKAFHDEYKTKKNVKLLPYAAWIRNETLFFEINHDPGDDPEEKGGKGKGMGRIKPLGSGNTLASRVDTIKGFDFANWLKNTVSEKDFVVIKMDVEGAEFSLIPRLFETGAICLIDEIFLECHYNRWQRCCPGQRSEKYDKTYEQCLDLFTSLRESGVLVHQWW